MSAAILAHDVGKYVARIARNVRDGEPMPPALMPMLARDLYELPGGKRASQRFEELASSIDDERITRARSLLARIDSLEQPVRAKDEAACRAACALAREVEDLLRQIAKDVK
jgi:hypothetical protein